MPHRSLSSRARTRVLGTAALMAASSLAFLPGAGTAEATSDVFAPRLVTVEAHTPLERSRLQSLGLDLTEHAGHDYVEALLHTPADLAVLKASKLDYDVRIPDLVARGVQIANLDAQYAATVARSPMPSGRTTYRTLADYNADMTALAKNHPTLVKRFALKRPTLDGKTVYGVEIGRDVTKPNTGQPTFFLMGLHHAREWPSGELAMEFAVDLAKNYGKNARITGLLDKARVIVVPVVNADGFDLSRTDGEYSDLRDLNDSDPLDGTASVLATPGQTYKRKNCRVVDGQDIPDGSCKATAASPGGFGAGVDLNRNYGGFWGGPGASGPQPNADDGAQGGVLDPTYRGASAFSEPETQNIKDLITSRQVTMLISLHTFSNLVLRPNGVNPNTIGFDGKPVGDAPDEAGLKQLGARFAAQNGYANIHGWQLYDTTGTTEDYSYNATGGYGYTFEVGANEFHPPYPEVVDEYLGTGKYAGKGNREAFLIALEHAVDLKANGVLSGRAPKGATIRLTKTFQTPTWASSFKDGIDTAIKVAADGSFRWIVNPSTRPIVQSRTYQELAKTPYRTQTIPGTTAQVGEHTDHEFTLTSAAAMWTTDLDWATPDDMDLEVYRKGADGKLTEVGSSGGSVGEKERVEIPDAEAGTYVLRVINFASASPSYTLTESLFDATTRQTPGTRESYTLTCEKDGRVLQTSQVYVGRGESKTVDLAACRRKG